MLSQKHVGNAIFDLVLMLAVGTNHLALLHMSLKKERLSIKNAMSSLSFSYFKDHTMKGFQEFLIISSILWKLCRESGDTKLMECTCEI